MASSDINDGRDLENLSRQLNKTRYDIGGPGGPSLEAGAGVPSGARVRGSMVINTTTGELYICTVAAGTYVKVGTQT